VQCRLIKIWNSGLSRAAGASGKHSRDGLQHVCGCWSCCSLTRSWQRKAACVCEQRRPGCCKHLALWCPSGQARSVAGQVRKFHKCPPRGLAMALQKAGFPASSLSRRWTFLNRFAHLCVTHLRRKVLGSWRCRATWRLALQSHMDQAPSIANTGNGHQLIPVAQGTTTAF
jgi:hypothetical protein